MTANEITRGLLLEIPRRFQARVWRRNVGAFTDATGRLVRVGVVGESDIDGIVGPLGRRLSVEVKAGKDRLSSEQKSFLAMVQRHGGIAVVARDVEGALAEIAAQIEVQR